MVVARRLREADCEVSRVDADVQGQPIPPSILVGDAILRVERVGHVGAELWPSIFALSKLVINRVEERAMVVKLLHIADYPAALIELRRVERSFAVAPRRNPIEQRSPVAPSSFSASTATATMQPCGEAFAMHLHRPSLGLGCSCAALSVRAFGPPIANSSDCCSVAWSARHLLGSSDSYQEQDSSPQYELGQMSMIGT